MVSNLGLRTQVRSSPLLESGPEICFPILLRRDMGRILKTLNPGMVNTREVEHGFRTSSAVIADNLP